jgi:hypothetical protein
MMTRKDITRLTKSMQCKRGLKDSNEYCRGFNEAVVTLKAIMYRYVANQEKKLIELSGGK